MIIILRNRLHSQLCQDRALRSSSAAKHGLREAGQAGRRGASAHHVRAYPAQHHIRAGPAVMIGFNNAVLAGSGHELSGDRRAAAGCQPGPDAFRSADLYFSAPGFALFPGILSW